MIPKWTGIVVKEMHLNDITINELASHMGYDRSYVSRILHGKVTPKGAEEQFRLAVKDLAKRKNADDNK